MRKYQAIWERIKNSPSHCATIDVHPAFFKRVVKAVIKEKHEDLGFKVLNEKLAEIERLYLDIDRDEKNHRIKFTLKQSLGLIDIVSGNAGIGVVKK